MATRFNYRCEYCGVVMPLARSEYEALTDRHDRLLCPLCRADTPNPPKARRRGYPRDTGCIVTVAHEDGGTTVHHRGGHATEALREIIAGLPRTSRVQTVSTPRSILRDLQHQPRARSNSRRLTDPYAVERNLLGKIGRLDLLPEEANL